MIVVNYTYKAIFKNCIVSVIKMGTFTQRTQSEPIHPLAEGTSKDPGHPPHTVGSSAQQFPACRRIPTHLQQTTFENIVAKGENDQQFSLLPQCFQLYLMI